MPRAPRRSDWAALFALTLMWGTAFMFNALALRSFPPAVLVAARITIGVVCLFAALKLAGLRLPAFGVRWLPIALMAILGTVLPFRLTAWAQQHIDSAVTGVLMAVMPLFVMVLAHVFVPGSRLTAARVVGFAVGFAGVVLVIGPETLTGLQGNMALLGSLAVLGAALSYSLNTIVARRARASEPFTLAAATMIVAGFMSMPGAVEQLPTIEVPPDIVAICALGFLGLLSTGLATLLYFHLIQGPGPTFVSLVNYVVPAWAVIAGAAILGESLSPLVYVGLFLILASIAISELGPRMLAGLQPVRRRSLPSR